MTVTDALSDAALDYSIAYMNGILFADWDGLEPAHHRLRAAATPLAITAIAASSGATDELNYYTEGTRH